MVGRGKTGLLLSSSVAALLIGGGAPAAFAACANGAGSGSGFDNPAVATTPCVAVTNTSFSGNITNEGTIAPGGVTFTNGTMSGFLASSGNILGGLSLDNNSTIINAVGTTVSLTGSTFLGGISNAGLISAAGRAINVSDSTFGGGIANTGTIAANTGITVQQFGTFQGGISNGGTIMLTGGGSGIAIFNGATFSGPVSNSGTISASNGIGFGGGPVTLASGGITNSGTIAATNDAIFVNNVATFAGAINNSGTVSGQHGAIFVTTVNVFGSTSAGGGIVNSGTITAASGVGIRALSVATFLGGITNSGTIAAGGAHDGIEVTGSATFQGGIILGSGAITAGHTGVLVTNVATFLGGISNGGTISAGGAGSGNGIFLTGITTFSGGISNSGTIAAASAAIGVTGVSTFTGGIANSGTLSAAGGISVQQFGTFQGGISNGGSILLTGGGTGILVNDGVSFAGPISNSGTISAGNGIEVGCFCSGVSIVTGGITNSGTVAATNSGILVSNVATFTGAINNSGTVSAGHAGIAISSVNVFGSASAGGGIVNSGTIASGSAGIAVAAVATFLGGITNSGMISQTGFFGTGIKITDVGTFSGGIANSGTIAGFDVGIDVCNCVTTFLGGINNSGTIAAGSAGISVSVSTFRGGITNSGTILASGFAFGLGVAVSGVATFDGGISNSGLISAGGGFIGSGIGIGVAAVSVFSGGIDNGATGTITASLGGSANFPLGIQVTQVETFNGDIINRGLISLTTTSGIGISVDSVSTFAGRIANSGTIAADFIGINVGHGTGIGSTGIGSFGGGVSNGGLITLSGGFSSVGIRVDEVSLFTGGIANSGTITGAFTGILVGCGCGVTTFLGGISNSGVIAAVQNGIVVGSASGATISTFAGGITNSGTISGGTRGIWIANAIFVGGHIVNSGTIAALTAIDLTGAANAITIDQQAGLVSGDIALSPFGDTLNVTGGTINGNVIGPGASGTVNFALGSGTFTYAAPFAMNGLSQVNFNSGTVFVDGTIQATNLAVNNGGTAAGTGLLVGAVTVMSGGTLMPGDQATPLGTINVVGSLTFNAGSFYAVHIAPGAGNNSATLVNGAPASVTINGGTVVVTPQFGHYNATSYTIVSATGPVSGRFAGLAFAGPLAFSGTAALRYDDTHDVFLDIGNGFVIFSGSGANQNQQNVINGINNFILGGGTPPGSFQNLANLSGPAFLNALTQLSGENNAGFFQGAFQAGNSFLNLMVNPFLDGRFGTGGGFGAAMGFAADGPPALPQAAAAFASAMPVKATTAPAVYAPHYSVWGAAYGGSGRVTGDPAVGSHDTSASTAAFAAGIDYRVSPNTMFGIALAGGGTSWDLTGGLGGGSSDMFQAGVYGSHHWSAAYLSGALSYNFHDVTTHRTLTIAGTDMLQARFEANGVGARIESGYRYATPWMGITPYAAVQAQSIALPNYGETATAGSNQFALNVASQTATTTRSELGAWLDTSRRMDGGALLKLYGRAAWAHDFGDSRAATAIFQGLPGSNFVVNGATPARDGALVTGAAQYSLPSGWSFLAKFDGEFSSTTSIYTGSGMVKKVW